MAGPKGKGCLKGCLTPILILFVICSVIGIFFPDASEPDPLTEPTDLMQATSQTDDVSSSAEDENHDNTSTPINSTPLEIHNDSTFSIHFIDVGQADAALVECDGHYMLIDGGNTADSRLIYSVLKSAGADHLSIVLGSHLHEDHIGGLAAAYQYADVDLTLCPVATYDTDAFQSFAKYADEHGGIKVPSVGDTYPLGSATVTILGVNGGSDANNSSIILRIDYGKTSFLFAGDAERDAEQAVLNSGADLAATVLKVGHHGSDTSSTYPFLRAIMPQFAVISVGEGNSYGHPTEDALSRLRDADVTVFRTDLQGDVRCASDGETVSFEVSRNPDADVFSGIGPNSNESEPVETEPLEEALEDDALLVWIPRSGSKYHSWKGCSNMKDPSQVTEEEALSIGYERCKKCW